MAHSLFEGKTVVVTGTFVTMKRNEAEKLLSEAGALLSGSVSKKTQLLIYGKDAGSKLSKAMSLGVATMTEQEMIDAFSQANVGSETLGDASKKLAKAAKEDEKKYAAVRKTIAEANQPYLERLGLTPGTLLLKYFQVFAQRPDIHITECKLGAPANNATLYSYHHQVPKDYLALCADVGTIQWSWVPKDRKSDDDSCYFGGFLKFRALDRLRWYPKPDWWDEDDTDAAYTALIEDFVSECNTHLAYKKNQRPTQAFLLCDNANDCTQHSLGMDTYEFFTKGAKEAFGWYWMDRHSEATDKLLESSLPKDTPTEEIVELLVKKGLSEDDAKAMIAWLGEDVVILLSAQETAAGKAQQALLARFPQANQTSTRSMDLEAIERLAKAVPPMSQGEWNEILGQHEAFLESGGRGGTWQTLNVSGLPLCMYLHAKGSEGKQAIFRLQNLSQIEDEEASAPFADFSGCYASGIKLNGATLEGSIFIDSILDDACFDGAMLTDADFSGARLHRASFRNANLSGADFEHTDCTGADFSGAKLDGASFKGAKLDGIIDDAATKGKKAKTTKKKK